MVKVEKLTPLQVDIMRVLLKLNRGVPRKELLSLLSTKTHKQNLHLSLKPLDGFFIKINKSYDQKGPGPKPAILSLTSAGRMAIRAFNIANKE